MIRVRRVPDGLQIVSQTLQLRLLRGRRLCGLVLIEPRQFGLLFRHRLQRSFHLGSQRVQQQTIGRIDVVETPPRQVRLILKTFQLVRQNRTLRGRVQ